MLQRGLPRDQFDRVVVTHRCPVCADSFIGPAMCRGVGDGPGKRAHAEEVRTLPIYGCVEPPEVRYAVAFHVLIAARTEAQAHEMAERLVRDELPARVAERHGAKFSPVALESRAAAAFRLTFARQKRMARERADHLA